MNQCLQERGQNEELFQDHHFNTPSKNKTIKDPFQKPTMDKPRSSIVQVSFPEDENE